MVDLIDESRQVQLVFNITFACVFALLALASNGAVNYMLASPIQSARALLAAMPSTIVGAVPPLRMVIRSVATEVQLLSKGREASAFQQQVADIVQAGNGTGALAAGRSTASLHVGGEEDKLLSSNA